MTIRPVLLTKPDSRLIFIQAHKTSRPNPSDTQTTRSASFTGGAGVVGLKKREKDSRVLTKPNNSSHLPRNYRRAFRPHSLKSALKLSLSESIDTQTSEGSSSSQAAGSTSSAKILIYRIGRVVYGLCVVNWDGCGAHTDSLWALGWSL